MVTITLYIIKTIIFQSSLEICMTRKKQKSLLDNGFQENSRLLAPTARWTHESSSLFSIFGTKTLTTHTKAGLGRALELESVEEIGMLEALECFLFFPLRSEDLACFYLKYRSLPRKPILWISSSNGCLLELSEYFFNAKASVGLPGIPFHRILRDC